MAKILAIGIATLDIINTVESFPEEDDEVRALSQQPSRGGNATNTLSILSQLGHNCAWAGVLIDEPDSQIIKHDLIKHRIDSSNCVVLNQGKMPTSYITLNQHTGSRTIVHHRDCPEFSFTEFKKINLQQYDWIHFEGRNIADTSRMIEYCKQQQPHLPCSVEIEKPRPDIDSLFTLADILLFSKHYAQSQGFSNATSFLSSFLISINASCAWGEKGAWFINKKRQIVHSPAFPPEKIVDTLGAGDTFNAAFIHALLKQKPQQAALNFACQVAGYKCGRHGLDITHYKLN